jgi:hypothetical protein
LIGTDTVSTLACVLLLGLMLCWMLSGVAFFVDRYRLPLLATVLLIPFLTAWLPWSDQFSGLSRGTTAPVRCRTMF